MHRTEAGFWIPFRLRNELTRSSKSHHSKIIACVTLLGSLMQLLQLLYAFHFTQGKCLPSVYNPHSLSLCLSIHSLSFFFSLSLSAVMEWLSALAWCVWWVLSIAYHCCCQPSSAPTVLHVEIHINIHRTGFNWLIVFHTFISRV